MRFLENVRAAYTLPVEGGEDRHFIIDLRAIVGDRSCSTKMVLHVDTMCDMFDEIVISDKQ